MNQEHRPTQAARFFVLAFAVVCYSAAGVLFLNAGTDYLWGMATLGVVGTIYLGLFMFASTGVCEAATLWLTAHGGPW